MIKRTLVFSSPLSLSLKNEQLVIYNKGKPEVVRTIPIEDIGYILIDNPMLSLTMPLINALSKNNVALIFCDEKSMPLAMLMNLKTNETQGETLRLQIRCNDTVKGILWKQIVTQKILNQSLLLKKIGCDGSLLKSLYMNVKRNDLSNCEGTAARIYWQQLFGADFRRGREIEGINSLLNYGYTILRSATAKALMGSGLFPSIGLHHKHRSNAFPLADDMMEPFRPFVDEVVCKLIVEGHTSLTQETKSSLLQILVCDTQFDKQKRPLSIALTYSSASLVKCLSKESRNLIFPQIQ